MYLKDVKHKELPFIKNDKNKRLQNQTKAVFLNP